MKFFKLIFYYVGLATLLAITAFIYSYSISLNSPNSLLLNYYEFEVGDYVGRTNFTRSIFGDVYVNHGQRAFSSGSLIKIADNVKKNDVYIYPNAHMARIEDKLYFADKIYGHRQDRDSGTWIDINQLIKDPQSLEIIIVEDYDKNDSIYTKDTYNVYYDLVRIVKEADPGSFKLVYFEPSREFSKLGFRDELVGYDNNKVYIDGNAITSSVGFEKIDEITFATVDGVFNIKGERVN